MLVLERQNADDVDDETGVLACATPSRTLPSTMTRVPSSILLGNSVTPMSCRSFAGRHSKALRRRIHVLGLVQYQYRHRVDAVAARKFAKMHVSRKVVPDLQPKAWTAADDAAGQHDAEADTGYEAQLTHRSSSLPSVCAERRVLPIQITDAGVTAPVAFGSLAMLPAAPANVAGIQRGCYTRVTN